MKGSLQRDFYAVHGCPAGRHDFPWERTAITYWDSGMLKLDPQDNTWKLATHTFRGYPAGIRRAIIVLKGKDEPWWAGHYGAKFAAPELHFGPCRWPAQAAAAAAAAEEGSTSA